MPPAATESPLPTGGIQALRQIEEWDRGSFWSSYSVLFKSKGYTLYTLKETAWGYEYYEPVEEPDSATSHIYTFFSRRKPADLRTDVPSRHIMYAQDVQKRDVVIKLVETDSVEHRIHAHLMDCAEFRTLESFPFIIPTLEILPSPHKFSFVIMPRWGDAPYLPEFCSMQEILSFIEHILRGLDFLHSHRIVHLDIDFRNILVNQFTHTRDNHSMFDEDSRASLRVNRQIRYCLFDFNMSHMFPLDASSSDCYLPTASVVGRGAPEHHPENDDAELDPFKFDVACMGNMLRSSYCHILPAFPSVATLFDRMTTNNVARRFTASEALSFCQFIQNSLTAKELDNELPGHVMDMLSTGRSSEPSTRNRSGTSVSTCSGCGLNSSGSMLQVSSPLPESKTDE